MAFLANMSRLVSTSIADVECKHAQSQHWSDRPFATMVAKHINSELKSHKQEAQHQLTCQLSRLKEGSPTQADDSSMVVGNVVVEMQQKQIRRKPAYMFFRDDWIQTCRQCGSETINPASKTFWSELKKKFSELNPERKAYYEELSRQSDLEARGKRDRRQQRKRDTSVNESVGSSALGSQQLDRLHSQVGCAMNPWLVKAEDLAGQDCWDGISDQIEKTCLSMSCSSAKLLGDEIQQTAPLSEEMLQKAWQQQLSAGLTWADTLAQFDKEAQQFAEPSPEGPTFPKQVFYQGCCGVYCRHRNSQEHVALFVRLLDAFAGLVQGLGPIGAVSKKHILLQLDVTYSNGCNATIFAWLVAPAAKSGIHAAQQSFILCEPDHYPVSGTFELTLKVLQGPRSLRRFAHAVGYAGSLHQLDAESGADYLMNLQSGSMVEGFPEEVLMRRLQFEDLTLAKVKVTGYDSAFEPIRVHMGGSREDADVGPLNDYDQSLETSLPALPPIPIPPPGAPPPDDDHDGEGGDVETHEADLLAMVCDSVCDDDDADASSRRKRPRKKNPAAKSKAEIHARVAEAQSNRYSSIYMPDEMPLESPAHQHLAEFIRDPSVVASLDSDQVLDLSQAVRQCELHHTSVVDASCKFDLQPDDVQETAQEFFGEVSKHDQQDPSENPPSVQQMFNSVHVDPPKKESELASQPSASSSSRASAITQQETVLSVQNGKTLKLVQYQEPKFGNLVCELREHHPSGISTAVGRVNLMTHKGRAAYKAHCSVHKSCQCWVQTTDSLVLDKLVAWLAKGPNSKPVDHTKLSKELRESLGVKVRA
eukprot:Skav211092  [mRNA]  locus=scaffold2002:333211:335664:- [translate_table: standard]